MDSVSSSQQTIILTPTELARGKVPPNQEDEDENEDEEEEEEEEEEDEDEDDAINGDDNKCGDDDEERATTLPHPCASIS